MVDTVPRVLYGQHIYLKGCPQMVRNRVACAKILRVPAKEYDQFFGSPMDAWQVEAWDVIYDGALLMIELRGGRLGHDRCLGKKLFRGRYTITSTTIAN